MKTGAPRLLYLVQVTLQQYEKLKDRGKPAAFIRGFPEKPLEVKDVQRMSMYEDLEYYFDCTFLAVMSLEGYHPWIGEEVEELEYELKCRLGIPVWRGRKVPDNFELVWYATRVHDLRDEYPGYRFFAAKYTEDY